jgi:hypothetical protein
LLEARIAELRLWPRALACKTLLIVEAERRDGAGPQAADARAQRLLGERDPMLREAAAMWWAHQQSHRSGPELERCLADDDVNVVCAAVQWLDRESLCNEVRRRLEGLASDPPKQWICRWCGQRNDGDGDVPGCTNCKTSPPSVVEAINRLLKGERRRTA